MMEFQISGGNADAKITVGEPTVKDGITYVPVSMHQPEAAVPGRFTVKFFYDNVDTYSTWGPSLRYDHSVAPSWGKRWSHSRLASWMPLHQLLSAKGNNRLCIALSDGATPTQIGTGIHESDGKFECEIQFFTVPSAPLTDYTATIRLDTRDIPYYDSIYDAVDWWENECGYTPAYVPDCARMPMNSLWYSYHQNIQSDEIVRQCEMSKPLGMDTVLIDDGWQTENNYGGYGYCGDWEVAKNKIPDMKDLIDRIHGTGMKAMIWYSVPFMGVHTKNYEQFKDMTLDNAAGNTTEWFALDPRYKKVRDFLVNIYATAVKNWGLDGLKLDFIDSFALRGKSLEPDPRRDYISLEDGVDALLREVTDALKAINPEIMIEFRQSYIGPVIRRYGNMLRVTDCPNDAMRNRVDVVNMRYTSGKSAVHSDMLMWNYDDAPEVAAEQLTAILYSVPQISVRIDRLQESHKKMLGFYLDFWRKNRDVLMDGKIIGENPESDFSLVTAELDDRAICTLYTAVPVKKVYKELTVVNASDDDFVYLRGYAGRHYTVKNCLGEEVAAGTVAAGTLAEVKVPHSGMIILK